MKRAKKPRDKKWGTKIITVVCLSVFVYAVYELVEIGLDYYFNRQALADVQEVYEMNVYRGETESKDGEIRQQFDKLHELNSDIVGWITIDGTNINYPILQADNNDYYLYRNYKEEDSRAGSIFMDYRNDISTYNRNIILYGHNMKDGTMFQNLKKYLDEEFYEGHRQLFFDTQYDSFDAEVFSVYYTTTDFDYIQTDFNSELEYQELIRDIQEKSIHHADVQLDEDDTIITMSTCDYTLDPDEGRLVVHAKLKER